MPNAFSYFGCITEDSNFEEISKLKSLTAIEIRADKFKKLSKSFKTLGIIKELIPGVQTIFTFRSEVNKSY